MSSLEVVMVVVVVVEIIEIRVVLEVHYNYYSD